MTKRERHEIAVVVKAIMTDECNEIRDKFFRLHNRSVGLRKYVRKECIEFWSNHEPYLDNEYDDVSWIKIGNHIINFDKIWCFIRDGLTLAGIGK